MTGKELQELFDMLWALIDAAASAAAEARRKAEETQQKIAALRHELNKAFVKAMKGAK